MHKLYLLQVSGKEEIFDDELLLQEAIKYLIRNGGSFRVETIFQENEYYF